MNILTYTGLLIDRKPDLREKEDEITALREGANALVIPVHNGKFFFEHNALSFSSLTSEETRIIGLPCEENIFLGMDNDQAWFVLEVDKESLPKKFLERGVFESLNNRIGNLPVKFAALLAYARGMILWRRNNLFCGRCGSVAVGVNGGHVRLCQNRECLHKSFPRTDPAVITLVEHPDGQHCLLGRQGSWPEGMYSIVAGFLEIGESIEECVVREIKEETGILVTDVKYHASQPWPFPSSLMLGFTAKALTTSFKPLDNELEDILWVSRYDLKDFGEMSDKSNNKKLPTTHSIARMLIEKWREADNLDV